MYTAYCLQLRACDYCTKAQYAACNQLAYFSVHSLLTCRAPTSSSL